jgi:hypothetical protein
MSAIGHPSPVPAGVPEQFPPPQRVPPAPKRPRPWKVWLVVAVIVAGAWVAYKLLTRPQQLQRQTVAPSVRTARLAVGTLERTLRLGGETSARNYASITVPRLRAPESRGDLVLIKLAKSGSLVKKGDLVAELDTRAAQDHIDDVASTITQAEADVSKRKAEQAMDWGNLEQTLKVAKASLDKATLDNSASEVRTPIDQELLKLAEEEAAAKYKQLQGEVAFKQAVHQAELRILDITQRRHVMHRDRHVSDIKRATFYAPMDGLVVMQTFYRGGEMSQIQLGDDVDSGQTFMKIVDTSSMQVETNVNQTESRLLRVGQPARISLDAFPGLQLQGKVYSVGAMGVRGWRENYYIRTIPVSILIEGNDPRLIPDLSAAADVVLERKENALILPLGALQSEKGKDVVYVKRGDRFERREVTLGMRTATQAAVLSGLEAGDDVALGEISSSSASRP